MTRAQLEFMQAVAAADDQMHWYDLGRFHWKTVTSVVNHGWIEGSPHKYRDEVWGRTDSGKTAQHEHLGRG
jgi:hypothetical protein